MPIQITITAESALEATQLVHDLAGTMSGMDPKDIPDKTGVSTVETKTKPNKNDAVKETKSEPKTEPGPKQEEAPKVEDLRAKAAEKAKDGKKDEIKALLDEFGAKTVSAVPKAKRAEFLQRLGEL